MMFAGDRTVQHGHDLVEEVTPHCVSDCPTPRFSRTWSPSRTHAPFQDTALTEAAMLPLREDSTMRVATRGTR